MTSKMEPLRVVCDDHRQESSREEQVEPRRTLIDLPAELLTRIMASLTSSTDLESAARSCKTLQAMVRHHEPWIATQIARTLINPHVLPAAMLVHEARKIPPIADDPHGHAARVFLQEHLIGQPPPAAPMTWSIALLADVLPLYTVVHKYARKFADHCMKPAHKEYFGAWDTDAMFSPTAPPTDSEMTRVEISLYYYELFCVLFGHDPTEALTGRAAMQVEFRNCFAPWELEQIACVFDVLRIDVYHAFREVARHDVTYGFHMVEYDKRHSPWMRHVLETGLEFMYEVQTAPDFDSRVAVLQRQHTHETIPRSCSFWPICWELPDGTLIHGHDFAPFAVRNMPLQPVRTPEPDGGPRAVWRWICRSGDPQHPQMPLAPFDRWVFRHKGYVFWDAARVEKLQVAKRVFLRPRHQESYYHTQQQLRKEGVKSSDEYSNKMTASFLARKIIFTDGGRGYWDFSDTSRVSYGHSKIPTF